jgi:uncharacterized protein (DUF4213/DUF364 family)
MSIADEYLALADRAAHSLPLPAVRQIYVAGEQGQSGKSSKFGAMVLEDDTVGLTYVDLDECRKELLIALDSNEFIGRSPAKIAPVYAGVQNWQRALGMAAVNAISQCVLRESGYLLTGPDNTLDMLLPEADDHIGMVGYFPPLVEKIRQQNIGLTVIELDEKWIQQEQNFKVTLDSTALNDCNKVICTGTVLINQTLEAILEQAQSADEIYLIGPTMGCLPDPLFKRGVTAIGGREIVDYERFVNMWSAGESWRAASQRYVIRANDYPGIEALLNKCRSELD